MNMKNDSMFRDLIAECTANGWRLEKTSKAFVLIPPDKSMPMVNLSRTPSDMNAVHQVRRRCEKSGLPKNR